MMRYNRYDVNFVFVKAVVYTLLTPWVGLI